MTNCLSSLSFSSCELTSSSFVLPFLQLLPCQDALWSVYMLIFFPGFFLLPISGLLNFHENMMVDASRCECLIVLLHTCFCFWCNGQIVALLAPLVYSEFLFIRLMPFHVIQPVLLFLSPDSFFCLQRTPLIHRFMLMGQRPCQLMNGKLALENSMVNISILLTYSLVTELLFISIYYFLFGVRDSCDISVFAATAKRNNWHGRQKAKDNVLGKV